VHGAMPRGLYREVSRPVLEVMKSNQYVTAVLRESGPRGRELARRSTASTHPPRPWVSNARQVGEQLANDALHLSHTSVQWSKPRSIPYHGKLAAVVDSIKASGISVHSPGR